MDCSSELNLFVKRAAPQGGFRNPTNVTRRTRRTVHKDPKLKKPQAKRRTVKKQDVCVPGFRTTYEPQMFDAWNWNSDWLTKINFHCLSHPTHPCSQVIQGYFEFAGGGAAEQACEALNAVAITQINIKSQADWDRTKMTALQNQQFVKHEGEGQPCRFGDIMNLVAPESLPLLEDKCEEICLSQLDLLAALQIRKCYIKESSGVGDAVSYASSLDSTFSSKSDSQDNGSDTVSESDESENTRQPDELDASRGAMPTDKSIDTADISISESDISSASDVNDIETITEETLRTKILNLFDKDGCLKSSLGPAQSKWKLVAAVNNVTCTLLRSVQCVFLVLSLNNVFFNLYQLFCFAVRCNHRLEIRLIPWFSWRENITQQKYGCLSHAGAMGWFMFAKIYAVSKSHLQFPGANLLGFWCHYQNRTVFR